MILYLSHYNNISILFQDSRFKENPSSPSTRPSNLHNFYRTSSIQRQLLMDKTRVTRRDLSGPSTTTSTSSSVTQTVNGSHEFRINGFSLCKGLGAGKYIASETFYIGGFAWAVYFYPDGKSAEDNASYVSLFIALASEGTDVRALFELTLMDQSGKGRHKVHSHFGKALESGPYTLKYRGSMWGYKRFFKRSLLESSNYFKDNCLVVRCCVGVVKTQTEGPKTYTIAVPPSDIGQHFGKLLESGKATDVTFEVDGEEFAAHKLVLAARSPVFRAQLFGPMKDQNTKRIKVEDMEATVFKVLLHFIYWDSLPDMEESIGLNTTWVSTLMAQHLLAAADHYALERLRLLCEAKLCEDVAIGTVATTLALAEQHQCIQLKAVMDDGIQLKGKSKLERKRKKESWKWNGFGSSKFGRKKSKVKLELSNLDFESLAAKLELIQFGLVERAASLPINRHAFGNGKGREEEKM